MDHDALAKLIRTIVREELRAMVHASTSLPLSSTAPPPPSDPAADAVKAFLLTIPAGVRHRAAELYRAFLASPEGQGSGISATLFGRRAMASGLVGRAESDGAGRVYWRKG